MVWRHKFIKLIASVILTCSVIVVIGNASGAQSGEPFSKQCGPYEQTHVVIVGEKSDLIEIWDGPSLVFRDYNEARASMDGEPISCKDIQISRDLVAARLGHEDDILHAYHLIRGSQGKVYKISFLIDRFRDGKLNLQIHNWDILVAAGENNDLFFRRCAGWQNKIGNWGKSADNTLRSNNRAKCQENLPSRYTYSEERRHGGWNITPVAAFSDSSIGDRNNNRPSPNEYGFNESCTDEIPNGWIRVDSNGYRSKCDRDNRGDRDRTNSWSVVQLSIVPIGNVLNTCLARVPDGWRRETTFFISGDCQNSFFSNDFNDNRMTIRRAE